ncbi:hypothetical protein U1Q18_031136 [Sarracenia purpurea var. burkii]
MGATGYPNQGNDIQICEIADPDQEINSNSQSVSTSDSFSVNLRPIEIKARKDVSGVERRSKGKEHHIFPSHSRSGTSEEHHPKGQQAIPSGGSTDQTASSSGDSQGEHRRDCRIVDALESLSYASREKSTVRSVFPF